MKRKLIQQGPSTLMVSLPWKWVEQQGLKKGDELELEESSSSIYLFTKKKAEFRRASIDLAEYKALASRAIGALYKQGFDEIGILFSKPSDIDIVNKNLNEFIGFEIVSQSQKGCVIKEISSAREEEFDLILNRTVLLVKSVADDCLAGLKSSDPVILKSLPARDVTINKYANYCRRVLNKYGYKDQKRIPMLYYLIETLENLGDEYKRLVEFALDSRLSLDRAQLGLLEEINAMLEMLYRLVLGFSREKAVELYARYQAFSVSVQSMRKVKDAQKVMVLGFLSGMSRMMGDVLGPLLTMEIS